MIASRIHRIAAPRLNTKTTPTPDAPVSIKRRSFGGHMRAIARRIRTALLLSALLLLGNLHRAEAGINVWTTNGPEGGSINALAMDPQVPATLYAGANGGGVFKSTDGGGSWSAVNTGLTSTFVRALAIDPQASTTLYAGTNNGVFKSTDGAGTWSPANNGLANLSVNALAIDPQTPTTLYVGAPGNPGGVFKSTDGGGSWSLASTGLTNPAVSHLAIDPQTPTTLYAGTVLSGTLAGGVFKSTDGGGNWSAATTWLPVDGPTP